jgi:hypothetical protein
MADATEIRGDAAPTPAEAPAKPTTETADARPAAELAAATEATPTVVMTTTAESAAAVAAATPEAAKTPEAPVAIEVPIIPEAPIIPERSASASALRLGAIAKFRSGIVDPMARNRAAILAGGLGFAAGAGILAGAVVVMGAGHLFAASTGTAHAPWASVSNETRALKETVSKLEAQVAGVKAGIEASSRQAIAQRTQIASRYDQSTRTQVEMQARIAKIGDAVERLEKRVTAAAAAEATGSVAPRHAAAAAAAGAQPTLGAPPQPLGTLVETHAQPAPPKPPVLGGWAIRDVFRGRALVVSRRGVFEAAPGLHLPDLGRVEAVTRENGRWVVITEKGIITAQRRTH